MVSKKAMDLHSYQVCSVSSTGNYQNTGFPIRPSIMVRPPHRSVKNTNSTRPLGFLVQMFNCRVLEHVCQHWDITVHPGFYFYSHVFGSHQTFLHDGYYPNLLRNTNVLVPSLLFWQLLVFHCESSTVRISKPNPGCIKTVNSKCQILFLVM